MRASVLAPEGRLTIAQQFTAGANWSYVVCVPSRRDGRNATLKDSTVPTGRKPKSLVLSAPSDQSLGYYQPTLQVETIAVGVTSLALSRRTVHNVGIIL